MDNGPAVLRIDARLEVVHVENRKVTYILTADVTDVAKQLLDASGSDCTIGLVLKPAAASNGRQP